MHSLIFDCPHTGQAIDSAINTDIEAIAGFCDLHVDVTCPHCARRHRLPIKRGYFVPFASAAPARHLPQPHASEATNHSPR